MKFIILSLFLWSNLALAQIGMTPCWLSGTVTTCIKPVNVPSGGTGDTTLASNGVLYGNGTSAVQALAVNASATNKFLTQSSSNAPAWSTIVAGDLPAITQTTAGVDSNAAQRLGTNTNDSASSGNIGEEMHASVVRSSNTSISSSSENNLTALTLTAGDWDISGMVCLEYISGTVTMTSWASGIMTGANTIGGASGDIYGVPTSGQVVLLSSQSLLSTDVDACISFPNYQTEVANATTTAYHLRTLITFTGGGTVHIFGSIHARRMR